MRCTAETGFGREGKIKRKRIGKTRQREDEGGNGGEKMKNEITKKVPKDGAKGQLQVLEPAKQAASETFLYTALACSKCLHAA